MGFKDFWNRLTSGDKLEHVEEELEADRGSSRRRCRTTQAMKDDVAVEERYSAPMSEATASAGP